MLDCCYEISGYIGLVLVVKALFFLLNELRVILTGNPDIQKKYGKNCWAIVTGSTDGIGRGYVEVQAIG
jgi:17beta-estradiol 17-dehydrogenase / very-long-chain 3-oxoacyl-CoA reductase